MHIDQAGGEHTRWFAMSPGDLQAAQFQLLNFSGLIHAAGVLQALLGWHGMCTSLFFASICLSLAFHCVFSLPFPDLPRLSLTAFP